MRAGGTRLALVAMSLTACDALLGVTSVPDAGAPDARQIDASHDATTRPPADAASDAGRDGKGAPDGKGVPDATKDAGREGALDAPSDVHDVMPGDAPAPPPSPCGGGAVALRAISPLSTSRVNSQHPTLTWCGDAGAIEICDDSACNIPITGWVGVANDHAYTATNTLSSSNFGSSVFFWRLQYPGGSETTPIWEFTVPAETHTSPPTSTSWGTTLDVDRDGIAELAVGGPDTGGNAGAVTVYKALLDGGVAPWKPLTGGAGWYGASVASAGDVNGDGYADLVVGAPQWDDSNGTVGAVYVYLGGSGLDGGAAPLENVTMIVNPSGSTTPQIIGFGTSVSSAGDVNCDGYADLVVGSPGTGTSTGQIVVFYGGPSGPSLSSYKAFTNGVMGAAFGASVASADVNGDGCSDILVGAPGVNGTAMGDASIGLVYVYLGGSDGPTPMGSPLQTGIDGDGFGSSVACAGDVNGDGYADILVGAPASSGNPPAAYLYLGSSIAPYLATGISIPSNDGDTTDFGSSVASAGDVNGDGYSDFLVGAPNDGQYGAAYLYLGNSMPSTGSFTSSKLTSSATTRFGRSLGAAGNILAGASASVVVGAPSLASGGPGVVNIYPPAAGVIASGSYVQQVDPNHSSEDGFGSSVFGATN